MAENVQFLNLLGKYTVNTGHTNSNNFTYLSIFAVILMKKFSTLVMPFSRYSMTYEHIDMTISVETFLGVSEYFETLN